MNDASLVIFSICAGLSLTSLIYEWDKTKTISKVTVLQLLLAMVFMLSYWFSWSLDIKLSW